MPRRYLFGPVTRAFADENLSGPRASGQCLAFDAEDMVECAIRQEDSWKTFCERLPADWQADFIVLYLPYTSIPACLWSAPVPLVGLAADGNLLWHWYRHCLPRCDLVLTDVAGVEAMRAEGMEHGRAANLFGLGEALAERAENAEKDIDILFVGNLHPAVQGERLGWLGRLARLSGHRRVAIKQGVFGDEYRKLLSRARIVFNRSIRGECNKRVFEAASGALLFQESHNREIQAYFEDRKECVLYDDDNLEELLEYYLDHEDERRCIADAARERVREFTFERLWDKHLALIEAEWEGMAERCRARCSPSPRPSPHRGEGELLARVWAALSGPAGSDTTLAQDLASALLVEPQKADWHYALGLATALERQGEPLAAMAQAAAGYFGRAVACDPGHVVAGVGLALALDLCGQRQAAIEQARQTLQRLETQATLGLSAFDAGLFPFGFDVFRVEWERCAWQHAGRPAQEVTVKCRLLRWRLHALLAEWTRDVAHAYEAALARPDLAAAQTLLGEALAAVKRPAEAIPHLKQALAGNPFDLQTSRVLFQALGDAGDGLGQRRLAEERRLLAKAAPEAVPAEPWIVSTPPAGDELASIIILCCNELAYTRQCLASVLKHTRQPYELILVDNGSTDGTAEYLQPWEGRQSVARRREPLEPDARLFDQAPAGAAVNVRGQVLPPQPGLTRGADALHPGAHAAWLCTPAPPGLRSGARAAWLCTPAPPGLRPETRAAWLCTPAPPGLGPERVVVIRNETNRGFPAGCNQGLQRARGRYVVFLNNDTIVTQDWLDGLIACSTHDWPKVGLVGPVTSYSAQPQQIAVDYTEVTGIDTFAAKRRRDFAGQALQVGRLTGFCLLVRREVLEEIGGFDERYGLGFFDDDDLCVRARQAGFQLLVALNVFVHHFGSRTFKGMAVDCQKQLQQNFAQFKEKWGAEEAGAYRLQEPSLVTSHSSLVKERAPASGLMTNDQGRMTRGVSLTMIVKNEEANLPACLESARDLFHEVIVVDTGSTDRTKEIAAGFGARVFDFPWVDNFAAARNAALDHATGNWIFWLDADDRVDEANRGKLSDLFAGLPGEMLAYTVKCLCPARSDSDAATAVDHVRLFPRHPQLRWEYRVHEQILPALRRLGGRVSFTDVVVEHTGYLDAALRRRKLERDLWLLHLENAEKPDEPFVLFNLGNVYQELGQVREALSMFQRSLARSQTVDSIVRKLYAMIAQCHRTLGEHAQALAVCRAGREYYPDDCELLFQQGLAVLAHGDLAGAERSFLQLLRGQEGAHFGSLDTGLKGYKARHNLAVIYVEQGRLAEAEAQWRAALAEQPAFSPALIGLEHLGRQRALAS